MTEIECHPVFDLLEHITEDADLETLRKIVVDNDIKTVVEIGSWAGLSTLALSRPGTVVYAVDTWQGNQTDRLGEVAARYGERQCFQTFCRNMKDKLFGQVFPVRGPSEWVAEIWPFQVDMVYLDADHRYTEVVRDIHRWLPHVRPGGWLCGHDYGPTGISAVSYAVDKLLPERQIYGRVWAYHVPADENRDGARQRGSGGRA